MKQADIFKEAKQLDDHLTRKAVVLNKAEWDPEKITFGKTKVRNSDDGTRILLEKLKIPGPYFDRIDDDLKIYTMNHLLKQTDLELISHLYDEGGNMPQLLGFSNMRTSSLSVEQTYRAILNAVPMDDYAITVVKIKPDLCRVDILTPREIDVGTEKKNDRIRIGGTFTMWPDMRHVPHVEGYNIRLVCSNGMIAPSERAVMKGWGKDPANVYERLADAVEQVFEEMEDQELVEKFKSLKEHTFDNREQLDEAMRKLFRTLNVPLSLRNDVIEAWEEEEDLSMFGIVNAFTAAANGEEITLNERRLLQSIGGNITYDHQLCPICKRNLN